MPLFLSHSQKHSFNILSSGIVRTTLALNNLQRFAYVHVCMVVGGVLVHAGMGWIRVFEAPWAVRGVFMHVLSFCAQLCVFVAAAFLFGVSTTSTCLRVCVGLQAERLVLMPELVIKY